MKAFFVRFLHWAEARVEMNDDYARLWGLPIKEK